MVDCHAGGLPAHRGLSVGQADSKPAGRETGRFLRKVESAAMKCVIQRVLRASVTVDGEVTAAIGPGLLILAGVEKGDPESAMDDAARKLRELRIFADDQGRMNRDVAEARGEILAVSQFTLAGSIAKGRRPGFDNAEEPERARVLFDRFTAALGSTGMVVKTGRFREHMIVSLENDGPVTFVWP